MEAQKTAKLITALFAVVLALYANGYLSSGSAVAGDSIDGLAFPGQLKGQSFVGGGTRAKYGAVKVYAVGLYIDAGRAASSLKPFVGLPAEKLPANFFKTLQTGKFDRTLLLQFHRAVAADTVAGALRDSLAGRLSAAALDKFRSTLLATLGDASVLKGAKIFFSCRGDSLTISTGTLSGNAQSIRDKTLCPAFIDVYLGPKPISPAAKAGVAAGFAARLYRS